ncbi:MAG: hypothetical protein EOO61_00735 [Hymenobacter sp.]|nr:MAG: hypothetical protein EOO61_00735 [Hymenobacter sp.]
MVNRSKALKTLTDYFETKGRVLTSLEYSRETDTPMELRQVKAYFGSWKLMEKLLMANDANKAPATNGLNVDALIKARNEAANEAANQWKEASENQDVKAQREGQAQAVAEVLARNAATPEGANANKLAIGGKLPQEQQDFSAMGATVETDPTTLEQTVVDTKPEVPVTGNADPKTPYELRDAAADQVNTGSVPVGTATAGGSTGTASNDTVNALGADTGDKDNIADKSTTNTSSTENTKVPADETKAAATKK